MTLNITRGRDGTFGLVLSDDNLIIELSHTQNSQILRPNDQIIRVGDVALGRERLADVMDEHYSTSSSVDVRISRPTHRDSYSSQNDVFVNVALLSLPEKRTLRESSSDVWLARPDKVWGTNWTMFLPREAGVLRVSLHNQFILNDPLVGRIDLLLEEMDVGPAVCKWYPLRSEKSQSHSDNIIVGEVLLTIRRFSTLPSVSPGDFRKHTTRYGFGAFIDLLDGNDFDSEMDDVVIKPEQHATQPMPLVSEPQIP